VYRRKNERKITFGQRWKPGRCPLKRKEGENDEGTAMRVGDRRQEGSQIEAREKKAQARKSSGARPQRERNAQRDTLPDFFTAFSSQSSPLPERGQPFTRLWSYEHSKPWGHRSLSTQRRGKWIRKPDSRDYHRRWPGKNRDPEGPNEARQGVQKARITSGG